MDERRYSYLASSDKTKSRLNTRSLMNLIKGTPWRKKHIYKAHSKDNNNNNNGEMRGTEKEEDIRYRAPSVSPENKGRAADNRHQRQI